VEGETEIARDKNAEASVKKRLRGSSSVNEAANDGDPTPTGEMEEAA